jgi:peptidoglycan hydrolase-like protein with peptidoglycan-binding domain
VVGTIFVLVIAAVAVGAIALASSRASLAGDPSALAKINLPLGGGRIEGVSAVAGRDNHPLPITLRGKQIWPTHLVTAGERVIIYATVKRPGSVAWLGGGTERLSLTLTTPSAQPTQQYVTLSGGAPLRIQFSAPVSAIASGSQGHLQRQVLAAAQNAITLDRTASAGSVWVAGAPRSWEVAKPMLISWFPAGAKASAVAYPPPGSTIGPNTPITLTFSKPIDQALGSSRPPVLPITPGVWHPLNSHAMVFRPEGYGYGLGAKVSIPLPAGVQLAGAANGTTGTWSVPPGSTSRLQQLLAQLGYLPLRFNPSTPVASTPAAQEAAAINPPKGTFTWRWSNIPAALRNMWAPGTAGVMTQGAIMSFENDQGMTTDGQAGPAVWKALMGAAVSGKGVTSFGYTFVQVSEGSPETESTWHSGKTVASGLVNTGVAATPTQQGVYPVFEHAPSVTMAGTNPDGSHYNDTGVPWVSYFHGGDALHGFIRGSYGYPQSDGCVEMPYSEASAVYPYTPIGTLVDVS